MILKIKKLVPEAKLPAYARPADAGLDFYALETTVLNPSERVLLRTGIATEFSSGYVGLIWDKSGLASKHGLKVLGGVIDAGYRGEILIGLINLSAEKYVIEKHHKIAQMLIQPVVRAVIRETEKLNNSSRAAGGFGSTGK